MSLSRKVTALVATKTLQRGKGGEDNDVIETRDSTCHSYQAKQGSINTSRRGSAHTRPQYIGINQKVMASTYETTNEGARSNDELYQSVQSHQALSVTALSVYQTAAPFKPEPPLIWLSDLHETRQVRAMQAISGSNIISLAARLDEPVVHSLTLPRAARGLGFPRDVSSLLTCSDACASKRRVSLAE